MRSRIRDRRPGAFAFVGVALYAVFLITAPFEHHDLLCELKTPRHCTSCTSSVVGSDPNTTTIVGACHLADAGQIVGTACLPRTLLLAVRSTGRSPPPAA
ncbi:MAG: hypothetical protein HY047_08835 [Acidobacteria bacterium]|nr:hypothetical protein [Acidobacteriota bacterium]